MAFRMGPFHRTPVKAEVYAPDWRDEERVRYTLDLVTILARLLPSGMDGGVSTAPLSYKPWVAGIGALALHPERRHRRGRNGARTSAHRRVLHLDIEPEPDCLIETSDEFLDSSSAACCPIGAPLLAEIARLRPGRGTNASSRSRPNLRGLLPLRRRVRRSARGAGSYCESRGIRVGRVQLSSALKVTFPRDETACAGLIERLRRFAIRPTCTR